MVKDIRNIGLVGAVEFTPGDKAGERGYNAFQHCFWKENVLVRCTGDIIAVSPPLIINTEEIDQLIEALRKAIKTL